MLFKVNVNLLPQSMDIVNLNCVLCKCLIMHIDLHRVHCYFALKLNCHSMYINKHLIFSFFPFVFRSIKIYIYRKCLELKMRCHSSSFESSWNRYLSHSLNVCSPFVRVHLSMTSINHTKLCGPSAFVCQCLRIPFKRHVFSRWNIFGD